MVANELFLMECFPPTLLSSFGCRFLTSVKLAQKIQDTPTSQYAKFYSIPHILQILNENH